MGQICTFSSPLLSKTCPSIIPRRATSITWLFLQIHSKQQGKDVAMSDLRFLPCPPLSEPNAWPQQSIVRLTCRWLIMGSRVFFKELATRSQSAQGWRPVRSWLREETRRQRLLNSFPEITNSIHCQTYQCLGRHGACQIKVEFSDYFQGESQQTRLPWNNSKQQRRFFILKPWKPAGGLIFTTNPGDSYASDFIHILHSSPFSCTFLRINVLTLILG